MERSEKIRKKVGLVPLLYKEYNYGGILQLYALQYVLKNLGYKVDIIEFNNDEKIREARNSYLKKTIIAAKRNAYMFFHSNDNKELENAISNRKSKIDSFKKLHYCKTINEKSVDLYEYDAFVCGSDQIWNPNWARRRCFLEFVPDDINKIIYAASLGVEEIEDSDKDDYKRRIERLNHVSVREYSAKRILDSFCEGKDIEVVVDPTLLLFPKEWEELCEGTAYENESYIFTYFLGDYSKIKGLIGEFARKKNLIIINIPFASAERIDAEMFGDERIIDASPGEFISLIRNAKYVFTDSFHACVFSTLFEKEFYVFERDGKTSMMDRILTLQKNFQLPNRIIPVKEIREQSNIDYSNNNTNQTRLRDQSLKYLMESLENE